MRNYSRDGINPDMEVKIKQILAHHTTGPMRNRVTFHLVSRKLAKDQQGVKLGTYGFIKGAQHFVAGEVVKAPYAEEEWPKGKVQTFSSRLSYRFERVWNTTW